jgi:hypothetical protein
LRRSWLGLKSYGHEHRSLYRNKSGERSFP